jgi:phosphoenolpyruvate-protein phosphotransferase
VSLKIFAPLAGWSAPLAEIPDAVFAKAMLGDGLAIDPTENELRAPCDGEIISIAASRHALALRAPAGAEILLHVGIDTVNLAGEGFTLHVRKGDRVHAGDLLLSFDLDAIAGRAPSLMTPVIITNGERFKIVRANLNREVAVGDVLLELEEIAAAASVARDAAAAPVVSEAVVVDHAQGIHARPAALIARLAKSLPYELEIRARGRGANPRSAVALMSLGIRGGDEMVIVGFEPAAAVSIAEIARLVRSLERGSAHTPAERAATPASVDPSRLRGVVASRGVAVGPAFKLQVAEIPVTDAGQGVEAEAAALKVALDVVRTRLSHLTRTAAPAAREIMTAHLELLDDPELIQASRRDIAAGKSAAFAWRAALRSGASALEATGDARLAERVDDLLDLERQVLVALGLAQPTAAQIPAGAILIARDLTPSQLIDIEAGVLAGITLAAGGPTSHVAILAAAMGIPMLVAAGPALLEVAAGTVLILDAESGSLRVAPAAEELAVTRQMLEQRSARRGAELEAAQADCRLASGERIEVFANLTGTLADAKLAIACGAEGCGLLRTEFLFLERETAPDETEQLRCYSQVAETLGRRPLVIRTLDAGGDKPIPYLPMPPEDNPALGLRGVRTSLWRPDLLKVQLRAILRVEPLGQCRILLPMITDVEEIRRVRALIDEARQEIGRNAPIEIGAMIETPASAVTAAAIAREVDFLSIGTNDLTQYTLAMDRGHGELAHRIDGLHPAVLALIRLTVTAAAKHQRLVAVCGGLASDPAGVPVLLGLGVRELSVVPSLIPAHKNLIRKLNLESCQQLAERALERVTATEVRTLATEFAALQS